MDTPTSNSSTDSTSPPKSIRVMNCGSLQYDLMLIMIIMYGYFVEFGRYDLVSEEQFRVHERLNN